MVVKRDLTPLLFAFAIEAMLTFLFWISSRNLRCHPGMPVLRDILAGGEDEVFGRLWLRFGGTAGVARQALHCHAKFEKRIVFIFVPVDSDAPDDRALHDLMEALVETRLARAVHAGRGFALKLLYMRGWSRDRALQSTLAGTVRVYRMSASEFLTLSVGMSQLPKAAEELDEMDGSRETANTRRPNLAAAERNASDKNTLVS